MKGYDFLKKALDGELEPKTIIRTLHDASYYDFRQYDYYIYQNDNMFHRCDNKGNLGAKYQDRFLNYKVLDKDFEFYCVIEEEKKIPEKLKYYDINDFKDDLSGLREYTTISFVDVFDKINEICDYLKSKGDE